MAAPKNNQFWKMRSKHGRDKIFATPEIMWEAACEYFQYIQDNPLTKQEIVKYKDDYEIVEIAYKKPFTIHGLCLFLDVNTLYFSDFENAIKSKNDEISKDFSVVISHIREIIYNQKFEGAASGFFNANIIARDLGLTDSKDITSKGEKIGRYSDWTDEQIENELQRLKDK